MVKTNESISFCCEIAGLIVEISTTRNMVSRCREYISSKVKNPDIVIGEKMYNIARWDALSKDDAIYLESGLQFYRKLLDYNGMMLHASAVEMNGKAYLFSGPSCTGKSTHTKLWKKIFADQVHIFNDDKPALRLENDIWYAYGTPWCGKDGINQNRKVKLAGICFLKQGTENSIRRLDAKEAIRRILSQSSHKFKDVDRLDMKLSLVDQLVRKIPIYELTNKPEIEAAQLSYETMRKGAEEAGL